jgi:hypothetical protein
MTAGDLDVQIATLASEESSLRTRLRALEDEIHSVLRRDSHANAERLAVHEKEIRRIVLRLVEIERERIEVTISESL